MKLTLAVLTLALFGSLLSAQEVPTVSPMSNSCFMLEKELFAALAPNQDQCGRLASIYQEVQPQLDGLYKEVDELNSQAQSLLWSVPSEDEEQVIWRRKVDEVNVSRALVYKKIKVLVDERTKKALGVLSLQQRQFLAELDRQARIVELFNQASGTGLIRGYNAFPLGNQTLGSIANRPRQ